MARGLLFIFAFVCCAFFTIDSYAIFEDYVLKQAASNIKYKENGVKVDREIAEDYLGMWISEDKQFGFTVYYEDETGTMYINSSKRALKFRFDSDNTLFVTDDNNNEFKVGCSIYGDTIYMTRPVSELLEYKITLKKLVSNTKVTFFHSFYHVDIGCILFHICLMRPWTLPSFYGIMK